MIRTIRTCSIPTLALLALAGGLIAAEPLGTAFTYHGRLFDGTNAADGVYDLRFTLYDAANAGNRVGSVLTNPVIGVTNGLFILPLDFGGEAFAGEARWLEIAVRTNAIAAPYTVLSPRQALTPTPQTIYAAKAGTANAAGSLLGPLSGSQLIGTYSNVVTLNNPANHFSGDGAGLRGIHALDAASGGPTNALLVASTGFVGIGTNAPQAGLHVVGGMVMPPVLLSEFKLPEPYVPSVFVTGIYGPSDTACVVSYDWSGDRIETNYLTIFDVSNPRVPRELSRVAWTTSSANWEYPLPWQPRSVFIVGEIVYIACWGGLDPEMPGVLVTLDISDPSHPQQLCAIDLTHPEMDEGNGPTSVFVKGGPGPRTAFVTVSGEKNGLMIVDADDPRHLHLVAELRDGEDGFSRLGGAISVFVSDTCAYVAAHDDNALTIIDVSNTASPLLIAEVVDEQGGFNHLGGANSVFVSGTVAYVTAGADNALTIIDVSSPASPRLLAEVRNGQGGFNRLSGPNLVSVAGTTAYVAGSGGLTIIDVSDPRNPRLLAEGGRALQSIVASGTTAYGTSGDSFMVFDGEPRQAGLVTEGWVGIGTTQPRAPLEVAGAVMATGFVGGGSGLTSLDAGSLAMGTVSDARLSTNVTFLNSNQTFTGTVTFNPVSGAPFAVGNSNKVANLNADLLDGMDSSAFWNLSGNAGTIPGTHFLGTTDTQPLEFRVNGQRVLTFKWNMGSPVIIGGHMENENASRGAVIVGGGASGVPNVVRGMFSFLGGGAANTISNSADWAVLGGGWANTIQPNSSYATIPGGFLNSATNYAFAAGTRAKANHTGAFVWGDSTAADVASTNANSVTLRASGGYRLFSDSSVTAGVSLAAGGGSWTSMSDRNAKENFAPVNPLAMLDRVAALPLSTWNYKSQETAVRHLGPTAQDFKAAFSLGESDTGITTIDADGVALAAIQGLNQKLEEKNAALQRELAELKALVQTLAEKVNGGGR